MILYSWKTVYKHSKGSSRELIRIIYWLTYRPKFIVVNGSEIKFYDKVDWSGNSFLKNPEQLLKNMGRYSVFEVAQYISLASMRSYGQYKLDHKLTLDLIQSPLTADRFFNNHLLSVRNGQIHFKLEEPEK